MPSCMLRQADEARAAMRECAVQRPGSVSGGRRVLAACELTAPIVRDYRDARRICGLSCGVVVL